MRKNRQRSSCPFVDRVSHEWRLVFVYLLGWTPDGTEISTEKEIIRLAIFSLCLRPSVLLRFLMILSQVPACYSGMKPRSTKIFKVITLFKLDAVICSFSGFVNMYSKLIFGFTEYES